MRPARIFATLLIPDGTAPSTYVTACTDDAEVSFLPAGQQPFKKVWSLARKLSCAAAQYVLEKVHAVLVENLQVELTLSSKLALSIVSVLVAHLHNFLFGLIGPRGQGAG